MGWREDILHGQTVARPVAEWMETVPAITGKFGASTFIYPTLGYEFIGPLEVVLAPVHDPMWDADDNLVDR